MFQARTYYGKIVQGDLRGVVAYLSEFPSKKRLLKKYRAVFEEGKRVAKCGNPFVQSVCDLFEEYNRRVFWQKQDELTVLRFLCTRAAELLNREATEPAALEAARTQWDAWEALLAERVQGEGWHYLGGKTQGFFGPYIWKTSKRKVFSVALPHCVEAFPIALLSDFVYTSWMHHLSFGKIGTGGWAGEDGVLCCIKKRYRFRMHTARFQVDFLKHEAQHAVDRRSNPAMTAAHMEYRAKLVQLIYAKNNKALNSFLSEASKQDPDNSHAVASYLLVRNLSQAVFHEPFVNDCRRWRRMRRQVKACASVLYDAYPNRTDL